MFWGFGVRGDIDPRQSRNSTFSGKDPLLTVSVTSSPRWVRIRPRSSVEGLISKRSRLSQAEMPFLGATLTFAPSWTETPRRVRRQGPSNFVDMRKDPVQPAGRARRGSKVTLSAIIGTSMKK